MAIIADIVENLLSGVRRRWVGQQDGSHAMAVHVVNPAGDSGGSGGAGRVVKVLEYICKTEYAEASVDELITFTEFFDATTLVSVGAIWKNETRNAELVIVLAENFAPASNGPMVTAVGTTADAAATADAGAFSIISILKRGLENWTALLGKIPALVGGRTPSEPLGQPDVSRVIASTAASVNLALTATCRRVSIKARTSDARFAVGAVAQTATATSHYIEAGERLDFAVPAGAQIAVIRDAAATADGTLQITELV